jgi:hypothetical protein
MLNQGCMAGAAPQAPPQDVQILNHARQVCDVAHETRKQVTSVVQALVPSDSKDAQEVSPAPQGVHQLLDETIVCLERIVTEINRL